MEQTISYEIENRLYLSITDRCTLECEFCPKTQGTLQVHEYDLTIHQRAEVKEIIDSIKKSPADYDEVVFCGYGEPTMRLKVVLEVAEYIKKKGGRVRLNTDGLGNLSNKKNVLPLMLGKIDALSVSMNAQNEDVYNLHCQPQLKGSFQAMLDFLKAAPEYIDDVTATAIDGLEGVDVVACEQIASDYGVKFRRRMLDIVG